MTGTCVDLFSEVAEVLRDNGNCSAPTVLVKGLPDGAGSCSMGSRRLRSCFLLLLGCCSLRALSSRGYIYE